MRAGSQTKAMIAAAGNRNDESSCTGDGSEDDDDIRPRMVVRGPRLTAGLACARCKSKKKVSATKSEIEEEWRAYSSYACSSASPFFAAVRW